VGAKLARVLVVVASIVALCGNSHAESGRVYGIWGNVLSLEDGTPLASASVTIVETGATSLTAKDGSFGFEGLDPGFYTLKCRMSGYVSQTHDYVPARGKNATRETISLRPNDMSTGDAVPIATRTNVSSSDFELSVVLSPTTPQVGDSLRVQVLVTNHSKEEVMLPAALDGSFMGRRYPITTVKLEWPTGTEGLATDTFAFCGNVNPLVVSDFHLLKPGAQLDLFGFGWVAPQISNVELLELGTYTLHVTYSTDSDAYKDWEGLTLPRFDRHVTNVHQPSPPWRQG